MNLHYNFNLKSILKPIVFGILTTVFLANTHVKAQIDPNLQEDFDELLAELEMQSGLVGLSASVRLPNGNLWQGAEGISGEGEDLTPEHVMGIADITQTFVATTTLMLIEDGLLALDDTVGNWISGIEHVPTDATIEQYLSHTSGIYSFLSLDYEDAMIADLEAIWTAADVLDEFIEGPNFEPGELWSYSSSNYLVLGLVIEAVTGEEFHDVIRDRILNPLGMDRTYSMYNEEPEEPWANVWGLDPITNEFVDLMAAGYSPNSFWSSNEYGAGMISDTKELSYFMEALVTGDLLSEEHQSMLMDFIDTGGGYINGYSLGLERYDVAGETAYGYTGTFFYRAFSHYYPEHELTITFMSNENVATYDSEYISEVFFNAYQNWVEESTGLISSELVASTDAEDAGRWPEVPHDYDVDNFKLVYYTNDAHGVPTAVSGLISVPANTECDEFPMIAYCHGTVASTTNVPSYMNYAGEITQALASGGFITVGPDYLGYGESESSGLHPYYHAETEATTTIDMIDAGREFLESNVVSDNGQVLVTGYSQGGHAAMATLKYAHENNIVDPIGIIGGAPLSGAYNQSEVMGPGVIYEQYEYTYMGYVAFTTESYQMVYENLYDDPSDFYLSPYDELIPSWIGSGGNTFDVPEAHDVLPGNLSDWVVDSVVTNMQTNMNHPIWHNLQDNDTHDWVPGFPLRMYYCEADDQVPYVNSTTTEEAMLAAGATDVQAIDVLPSGDHGQCRTPAFSATYEFFAGLAAMCEVTSVSEMDEQELEVYPNPTADFITLTIPEGQGELEIYDQSGRRVVSERINTTQSQIDLSHLATGVYVAEVHTNTAVRTVRVVVSR